MAKILIIEDDTALRTVLKRTLLPFGHEVFEADDGNEGLKLFRRVAVDLIVTDIVMPEKDGLEILMELKKLHSTVKVIAMSGGGRGQPREYLHMAKALGATVVLEKPFGSEALMAAVDALLPAGTAAE